jgi:hypothetical protein
MQLFAQSDSSGVFQKIMKQLQSYSIDTTTVPHDKITKKIKQLRSLKGGVNIDEAIFFKLGEEEAKNESPKETIQMLRSEFTNGKGKKWMDNAITWIYRQHFTFKELKQLVKFYKTGAGKKMATDFPVILLKSMQAAQIIQEKLRSGG